MIFGFLVNMENTIAIYFYSTPWALFPQKWCVAPEFFVLNYSTRIWRIRYGGSWSIYFLGQHWLVKGFKGFIVIQPNGRSLQVSPTLPLKKYFNEILWYNFILSYLEKNNIIFFSILGNLKENEFQLFSCSFLL